MDAHSFPNTFVAQQTDSDTNSEDMPPLIPLDAPESEPSQPQQQNTADVEMNDHNNDHDSESDIDAHEVEMQTVNDRSLSDHAGPNPSFTSHMSQEQPAVNNRRARVDDDEDEDRDRRHPSQRIVNSANATSSAGPSSSNPASSPQVPTSTSMPGVRLRGQAPIFSRMVIDEVVTAGRPHPFRFFQHLMSNNNNNDTGNTNPVPPSEGSGPVPAPPHQDENTPHNQHHGRFETFSVALDIPLGPAFPIGGGGQPPEGQPSPNAADPNLNANPNAQNLNNFPGVNMADFMTRLSQALGLGENGVEITPAAPTDANNPAGGAGATGAQFGFNIPFNLANLAGLGFGFNPDGSGFVEKDDPERARKLVDGLEEVPVGLVRRLEKVGGTGGGMGEDETKGGDGGCAICWERLLRSIEDVHQHEKSEKKEDSERAQPEAASLPKIVSLPCAHVFHADCLIPWFSRPRQTTCPTCRFNIDPENLTYVSWRRRMRERREREREEARARGDPENTDGGEASQSGIAPPVAAAATAAEPAVARSVAEEVSGFVSFSVHSQTFDALAPNVHPTPTPNSQSQPASSSSSSSSTSAPLSSQPAPQTDSQEAANDWDSMPGLEDVSDSDQEDDDEGDEDQEEDEDEDEAGDGAQEQENVHGTQAPPVLPHANEPPVASTPGAQTQEQGQARRNDPLAPRTIHTAHGLITLIPVPFNLPFPANGNGVGVGVQAGGDAAPANTPVPPAGGQGQGQLPNVNINVNGQAFVPALPQGHPLGIAFPHFHVQLPHMPEFGAQGAPAAAPANDINVNANANPTQAVPANPFVDAQEAAAITNTEEQLMEHLRSQGLTANEVENIRRSTVMGRQADRLRRGENPVGGPLDLEDEEEDDMDIDEGMGMLIDWTMNGVDGGIGTAAGPATAARDEQNRQDYDHVMNFLSNAARQAQGQAQAGNRTQGQAQRGERHSQGTAAGTPGAQSAQQPQPPAQLQQQQEPQQQQAQPQQQQGPGVPQFLPGLWGSLRPEDDRTINEFFARMFTNLGGPQQQAQQAQQAQRQDEQPQPQAQPQPRAQEPAAGPNAANVNANTDNNGRRPRQQAQFAFSNITFGPMFTQVPMFNPNGNLNGTGASQERVKKAWTLPPAPGPTLRQRIERKERDAGLRCYDISCGVGPSDEDPAVGDETIATGLRQLMIMSKNHGKDGKPGVCMHTFHPGCLVSAERVALGGADVSIVGGEDVEVSCPVCRNSGCVTKQEWEEGILALS